jgi:hypothetical protein
VESLPAHTGYRISELPHRAAHGEVRAAYIMGEDPLQTDAELSAVRKGFEDLELVIVQDIFMTKPPRPQTLFYRLRHGASMKAYSPRLTVASSASLKPLSRSGI